MFENTLPKSDASKFNNDLAKINFTSSFLRSYAKIL